MSKTEVMTPGEFELALDEGRYDFSDVTVEGSLNLQEKTVESPKLNLERATIEGDFSLARAIMKDLVLREATVGGSVDLRGAVMRGSYLERVTAEFFDLTVATVEGPLDLRGAAGDLYLGKTIVEGEIICDEIGLAIQCFFYFGSGVNVKTDAIQEVLEPLLQSRVNSE